MNALDYSQLPRWKRASLSLALVGSGLVLALHFTMTIVSLMPLNPIKVATMSYVDAYIHPFFTQKWDLFAPDPNAASHYLLVSCKVRDGDTGDIHDSPWLDTTTPLYEAHYRNRLGPAIRIARAEVSAIYQLLPSSSDLENALKKGAPEDPGVKAALDDFAKARTDSAEQGKRQLARAASAECDREYGSGTTVAVRSRILSVTVPTFSDRSAPDSASTRNTYDLDWMPYEQTDAW